MSGIHWNKNEIDLFKKLWPKASYDEIRAAFPKRSLTNKTIGALASKVKVKRPNPRYFQGTSMISKLSESDRGYLAGLIDSDGCITMARCKTKTPNKFRYAIFVLVYNSDKRMTDWVASKLPAGATFIQRNPGERRKLTMYQWTCSTVAAIILLREIAPYLVVKREQAEALANGYKHLPEPERYALYQLLRSYKTKGKQRSNIPS